MTTNRRRWLRKMGLDTETLEERSARLTRQAAAAAREQKIRMARKAAEKAAFDKAFWG